jgi:hypothetical protein
MNHSNTDLGIAKIKHAAIRPHYLAECIAGVGYNLKRFPSSASTTEPANHLLWIYANAMFWLTLPSGPSESGTIES